MLSSESINYKGFIMEAFKVVVVTNNHGDEVSLNITLDAHESAVTTMFDRAYPENAPHGAKVEPWRSNETTRFK
jgi:hypothetical protein